MFSRLFFRKFSEFSEKKTLLFSNSVIDSFHTYRVDWVPTGMTFFFDDQPYWSVNIDRIMQDPFYKEKGQPFDQDFYLILNVAVGGWFVDGPAPSAEFEKIFFSKLIFIKF